MIESSELIVNPDGSIYHLSLRPDQLADTVILVGDQDRVARVSACFDSIEHKVQHREFISHTGVYKGKRITALSTGIGTDNIDIVLNELDALANIDLEKREIRSTRKQLTLVRIGTSGSLQEDIPVDSFVVSSHALGLDGVLPFYAQSEDVIDAELTAAFKKHTNWNAHLNPPYIVQAPGVVFQKLQPNWISGITVTANGFYGPQGRVLRLPVRVPELNTQLNTFRSDALRISNYEMETSALYGLSAMMGHQAATVCVIIANRYKREYSKNAQQRIDELIRQVLDRLTA